MKTSIKSRAVNFGICATALLMLNALQAAAAADQSDVTTRTRTVSFAGLDLSTAQGVAEAHQVVERTIKKMCGQLGDEFDQSRRETYLDCIARTSVQVKPHLDALIERGQIIRTAAVK